MESRADWNPNLVWETRGPVSSGYSGRLGLGGGKCFAVRRSNAHCLETDSPASSRSGHRKRKRSHDPEKLLPRVNEPRCSANLSVRGCDACRANQRPGGRRACLRPESLHVAGKFVWYVHLRSRTAGDVQRPGHNHRGRQPIAYPAGSSLHYSGGPSTNASARLDCDSVMWLNSGWQPERVSAWDGLSSSASATTIRRSSRRWSCCLTVLFILLSLQRLKCPSLILHLAASSN